MAKRAVFIRSALVRGLNKIPLAVNHPWVQVFLAFGGSAVLVVAGLWIRNKLWSELPVWAGPMAAAALIVALFVEGAFEEWYAADSRAKTFEVRLQPAFAVVCDENFRVSGDQKWSWVVFRLHNTGMEAAHGCFVKIVSFVCTFAVNQPGVRAAPGAKFKWSNTTDSTCVIPGNSHEYVNIAFRHVDNPEWWALDTQGTSVFPMPPGTFELAIEACGENATSQTTKWAISYKPDELFRVRQIL